MFGRKRLGAVRQARDPVGRQRLLDQRHDALGVDDVGGEEDLHVAGDLGAGLLGLARRAPSAAAPRSSSSLPRAGRTSAAGRCCAEAISPGTLRPLARVAIVCACLSSSSTCCSTSSADLLAAFGQRHEQRAARPARRIPARAADFAVVGLQRLLLFAFQAAVDHQHDHDQHHDRRRPPPQRRRTISVCWSSPEGPRAADGAAAGVAATPSRGRSPTGRCRGARDDGRGAVSSSSSKNDKSQPLLCRDFRKGPV